MTTVVAFEGEYDLSLRERLRGDLDMVRAAETLVFDLRQVTYCEASCIAEFVTLARDREEAGALPVTIVPSPTIRRLFHLTGASALFSLAKRVDDLLAENSSASDIRHATRGYESLSFGDAPQRGEHPVGQGDSIDEAQRRFGGTA